jgi:hypothetical protein
MEQPKQTQQEQQVSVDPKEMYALSGELLLGIKMILDYDMPRVVAPQCTRIEGILARAQRIQQATQPSPL